MYFFEAQSVGNVYHGLEGRSNMYVMLKTNIEHDKHTSLSKAKIYSCLNNENSIVSNTLDQNSIVRSAVYWPLEQD